MGGAVGVTGDSLTAEVPVGIVRMQDYDTIQAYQVSGYVCMYIYIYMYEL